MNATERGRYADYHKGIERKLDAVISELCGSATEPESRLSRLRDVQFVARDMARGLSKQMEQKVIDRGI